MEDKPRRFEKGFFTTSRFPVAAKYLALASRRKMFFAGALVGLGFVILFLANAFVGRAEAVTRPLSESHALFAKDCSSCHLPGKGVANANCLGCHQKSGDARTFSFARHYEFHSGDLDRAAPKDQEMTCARCHREHKGRDQALQRVADGNCVSCHAVGSFASAGGHPEFQFVRDTLSERPNLRFPHVLHVREVMDRDSLPEAEAACVNCHVPRADGRSFQPIAFKSCDGCHLRPTESTPYVPLRATSNPGVNTIDEMRRSDAPGTQWAEHWNPGEVTLQGGMARKRPVYHADPWVLTNLKRLRQELFPGAELADLLNTSADVTPGNSRTLYREAIQTLRAQIEQIRGDASPDVQREVARLNALMRELENRLDQPLTPLDESKFAVTEGHRDPTKNADAYRALIDSLTGPCQQCHVVENATIRRPQTDQRSLVRAEFNHRAHVTHARCLDCHSVIPIRESLQNDEDPEPERDRAEILNLPRIAQCQTCHTKTAAPIRCASCHLFHPDKSYQSRLTR